MMKNSECTDAINEARKAYNELPEKAKKMVGNYNLLQEAETKFAEIIESSAYNRGHNETDNGTSDSKESNAPSTGVNDKKVADNKEVSSPTNVKISSVKNGKKKTLSINWKSTTNTNGYEIQYALDKKFRKSAKTKVVKSAKKTSLTIKRLKKGKTYYVRARAYALDGGKKVYGKWSSIKKIKIKK